MTIRKGSDYGEAKSLPEGAPIADDDAHLRRFVIEALETSSDPIFGLLGGDLCRTVGGLGIRERLHGPEARTLPMDLGLITIGDEVLPFVAHAVCGRPFGRGFLAVMNAQWWGRYDLGPRSHPGDGLLDITRGELRWSQRRIARRRARSGTHLPHPDLTTSRVSDADVHLEAPVTITIDHSTRVTCSDFHISVLPDAFRIVI